MNDAANFDGVLKLVLMLARSAAPARQRTSIAALEVFSFSCFGAATVLALVALGLAIAPRFGGAVACAVDAGLSALVGLALHAWARRHRARASIPMGPTLEALAAQIWEHLKQEKGLSIIAGLLVGLLAGGSRR